MDQVQKLLIETSQRLFADGCEPSVQEAAEEGNTPKGLWQAIEDNGLPLALVPEAAGGVELGLEAACAVLRVAGAFALPLPLSDTMLGAWILASAGIEVPDGTLTVAMETQPGDLTIDEAGNCSGNVSSVPWLPAVDHVVLVSSEAPARQAQTRVALLDRPSMDPAVLTFKDAAGDPMGDLAFSPEGQLATSHGVTTETFRDEILHTAALMRVCLIAGALDRILDLCIEHSTSRIQFGRAVAKFQAVQNLVAIVAGEAAAVGVSAPAAVRAWDQHADKLAVACAKTRAGEAAGKTARIAHQVHAAIGYTQEHLLHRFSRRLWSWRDQYGDEVYWSRRVGSATLKAGGDAIWDQLTANG